MNEARKRYQRFLSGWQQISGFHRQMVPKIHGWNDDSFSTMPGIFFVVFLLCGVSRREICDTSSKSRHFWMIRGRDIWHLTS